MRRLLLVMGGLALGTACCPIPVPRKVSVRPRIEVTVVDADGNPVPGAALTLGRWIEGALGCFFLFAGFKLATAKV